MSEVAREAAWLTTEEAEKAVARREGWVVSPAFFRRGKTQAGVAAVAAGALVASFVVPGSNAGFALFALAGLSLGLIPLVLHWEARQAAAREGDEELREGFGRGRSRFVFLIVRQGDAPTGEDRGMLWFEEGRLYFSGHRTSFGLVPSQARDYATVTSEVPGVRNAVNLVLDRDTPVGPMSLSFGLILHPEANALARNTELRNELDSWKAASKPKGSGQWPPAALGPGTVSACRLLLRAAGWTFLYPTLAAGFLLIVSTPDFALVGFLVLLGGLPTVSPSVALWRALRDRRRLGRAG